MGRQNGTNNLLNNMERAIPYIFPALGGLAGVIWVNLHKMDQLNPMYWIGGGIIVGFITARVANNLLTRLR